MPCAPALHTHMSKHAREGKGLVPQARCDPKPQGPLRARVGEPAWSGRAWGRPQSRAAGDAVHEHAPDGLQRDAHFLLRAHARRAAHLRPRPASLTGKHIRQQLTCACSTSSSL